MSISTMVYVRHAKNIAGDFYVVDGCCTTCDVPFREAPGLFAYTSDNAHCYVNRQPIGLIEEDQMIAAVSASEVSCIRYAGADRSILAKLIAVSERDQCDVLSQLAGSGEASPPK